MALKRGSFEKPKKRVRELLVLAGLAAGFVDGLVLFIEINAYLGEVAVFASILGLVLAFGILALLFATRYIFENLSRAVNVFTFLSIFWAFSFVLALYLTAVNMYGRFVKHDMLGIFLCGFTVVGLVAAPIMASFLSPYGRFNIRGRYQGNG